jgi:hypothetical protein
MAQLEGQSEGAEISESQTPRDGSDCYSAVDGGWSDDDSVLSDELEETGSHLDYPPVVGGWPLLNDDVVEEEPC